MRNESAALRIGDLARLVVDEQLDRKFVEAVAAEAFELAAKIYWLQGYLHGLYLVENAREARWAREVERLLGHAIRVVVHVESLLGTSSTSLPPHRGSAAKRSGSLLN